MNLHHLSLAPGAVLARFALTALLSIPALAAAQADRVILTPSPDALAPKQLSGEALFGIDRHESRNAEWLSGGYEMVEIEAAHFTEPRRQGLALSVEGAILPETAATPSVSIGVRDLLGTARHFQDYGYSGRNIYLAFGKTLPNGSQLPFPLRNVAFTAGVGTGVQRAVFGSVAADMGLGLRNTLEFDGRGLNYRLGYGFAAGIGRVEYERLHGRNMVGLSLTSPVRL